MKIYLAARYGRRLELCGYRDALREMGHEVTSRWLDGKHEGYERLDANGNAVLGDAPTELRAKFAEEDWADVFAADMLIAFTEEGAPRGHNRGGRHVELGAALAWDMEVIVCGPRENVFCCLDRVQHCPTWEDVLDDLRAREMAARMMGG